MNYLGWGVGIGALGFLLYNLGGILPPFIIGLVIAYILDKPVQFLTRCHIGRGLSALVMIIGVMLLLGSLIFVAIPYLQGELLRLAKIMPALVDQAFDWFPKDQSQITNQLGNLVSWTAKLLANILNTGLVLANILSLIVLTPIVTFYLVKDWPKLVKTVNSWLPGDYAPVLQKVDHSLRAYGKGQLMVCGCLMILYSIGLTLVQLPYGPGVGLLTGFLCFVPYIGLVVGLLISLSIAFTHGLPLWSIALVFMSITAFDANFLTPKLIGDKLGLHPVWILFAILAGGSLFGFVGVILALPAAAIIKVGIGWLQASSFQALHDMSKKS